jgi:ribosomal protein S18 acetylase RimI-like enzyme
LGVDGEWCDMEKEVSIVEADLENSKHQSDIIAMTLAYAQDAMGNNSPLPDEVLRRLVQGLKSLPTTIIFLAYRDQKPVGIATCFLGFSTFNARTLLNIHDFGIIPEFRNRGISRLLLQAVEGKARRLGCCKITLEVMENNDRARKVYESAGIRPAVGGKDKGKLLFYSKQI